MLFNTMPRLIKIKGTAITNSGCIISLLYAGACEPADIGRGARPEISVL
jgi:hypothetical protein